MKSERRLTGSGMIKAAIVAVAGFTTTGWAATFGWNQTATGAYDWNNPANWLPATGFPNAAGDVANVNVDLAGNPSIYLRQDITLGVLNVGDAAASANSFGVLIGNYPGTAGPPAIPADPAYTLTFDNGASAARIAVGTTGTPTNTISTPVVLNSALTIDMGPKASLNATNRQMLTFSGASFNAGSNDINIVGGFSVLGNNPAANQSVVTIGAATNLIGTGTITIGGNTRLEVAGTPTPGASPSAPIPPKSFAGRIVVNSKVDGGNSAGLTLINGSLANASEIEINGQFAGLGTNGGAVYGVVHTPGSAGSDGGMVLVGSGTQQPWLPGQRLSSNRLTLNGGTLAVGAQGVTNGAGLWQTDTIGVVRLGSGNSFVTIGSSATTAGQRVTATTLERGEGATLSYRPAATAGASQLNIGTAPASFMKSEVGGVPGAGTAGSATVGIVPWIVVGSTSGYGMNTFATYDSTPVAGSGGVVGVRALVTASETTSTLVADSNVRGNSLAGAGNISINSLQYTGTGVANMGAGRTITIKSGGLMLSGGAYGSLTAGIGAVGDAAAGTIDFGAAEGIIWNGIHSGAGGISGNTIGAALTGTGGLTKAGTGILVLAGANNIDGNTNVANGVLKVGNGTVAGNSSIGDGDVNVHAGAVLDLDFAGATNGGSIEFITDDAVLSLGNNGSVNAKLNIVAGVETVGMLFIGNDEAAAGYYGSQAAAAIYAGLPAFSGIEIVSSPALDSYFAGNGIVHVVPEPVSLGALGLAAIGLLRRRRVFG